MSVGINSVREILVRVPALLREPDMGDFIEGMLHCSLLPCRVPSPLHELVAYLIDLPISDMSILSKHACILTHRRGRVLTRYFIFMHIRSRAVQSQNSQECYDSSARYRESCKVRDVEKRR